MRRFRRIVAAAALGVAASALVAAPAVAENKDWSNPDGTRVTSVDPDGTRVTSSPQWWPFR